MDAFFYPSSPLFAGAGADGGVDAACALDASFDLAFLPPPAHSPQHAMKQELMAEHSDFLASPLPTAGGATMDWAAALSHAVPLEGDAEVLSPVHRDEPHAQRSSSAASYSASGSGSSSGTASGHTTPTLKAASPTPMLHASSSSAASRASSASTASAPTAASPPQSLLDRFVITIPDLAGPNLFATKTSAAAAAAAKRERKTQGAAAIPSAAAASKSVPKLATLVPPVLDARAGAASPSSVAGGYSSDSSAGRSPPPLLSSSRLCVGQVSLSLPSSSLLSGGDCNEPSADDDDATRRLKLARKAELARLSRKRKKSRMVDLESEVRRLEEELLRAKRVKREADEAEEQQAAAQGAADEAAADLQAQEKMRQVVCAMRQAVAAGLTDVNTSSSAAGAGSGPVLTGADAPSHPSALTPLIDSFLAAYNAHAGNCQAHLRALGETHMQPLRTFKFLNQIMNESTPSSAWSASVCRALALSPSSREFSELSGLRVSALSQHNFDSEISRAYTKLSTLLCKRAGQQAKNLNRMRAIFSEAQFVRYIVWAHAEGQQQADM